MYLEKFRETAQPVVVPNIDAMVRNIETRRSRLEDEINVLKRRLGTFLPIETDPRERITSEIEAREAKVWELRWEAGKIIPDLRLKERLSRFPMLSMEPLTWRNADGFPCFAVFTLNSPTFSLNVEWADSGFGRMKIDSLSLPDSIRKAYYCYSDAMGDALRKTFGECESSKEYCLVCQFVGIIPQSYKEKIADAKKLSTLDKASPLQLQIFIIAEIDEWKLEERVRPEGDPLIVGYHKAFPDSLWLIDAFDVTPMEQSLCLKE